MITIHPRARLFLGATLVAGLSIACGPAAQPESAAPAPETAAPAAAAAPAREGEHVFKGRVTAVDASAKSLTVDSEDVQGWMMGMTMSDSADKDDVYTTVKPGDQITAKVYDGDFKTLYDVQVAPATDAPAK